MVIIVFIFIVVVIYWVLCTVTLSQIYSQFNLFVEWFILLEKNVQINAEWVFELFLVKDKNWKVTNSFGDKRLENVQPTELYWKYLALKIS